TDASWVWYAGGCGSGSNIGTGTSITVTPGSTTNYYVRAESPCGNTTCTSYTLTYQTPSGDPTIFGDNRWRVYGFRDMNFVDYGGFYELGTSILDFKSQDQWAGTASPSAATGYNGCTISDDYHSVVAKRRGFPCGKSQINIPDRDDDAYMLINGEKVWNVSAWSGTAVSNVWTGYLDKNSTIEFRWREGSGGSNGSVELVAQALTALSLGTPALTCDNNNTGCMTVTPSGGTPPYLINIGSTFKVNSGKSRDITISSSAALSNYQVQIDIPFYTGAKSDFSDYRFYDSNGNLIPYWREKYTASTTATFWVKVPSISNGNTTIRVTYGNTDAGLNTTGSPHEVFELYDGFNSMRDFPATPPYNGLGADWISGAIAATSGTAMAVTNSTNGELQGGNNNRFIQSRKVFSGSYSVETKIYETVLATNGFMTAGFFNGTSNSAGILSHNNSSYYRNDGGWTNFAANATNTVVRDQVKVAGTAATVNRLNYNTGANLNATQTFTNTGISNEYIRLGARYDNGNYNQNYTAAWDWIFVRKATATEPTITIGAEQSSSQFCGLANNSTQSVTVRDNIGCSVTQNVTVPALP
ncbi:MAG TPA: DUF2341 domain-containing protein, partial [Chitinophagales bacterium]|nr:DUF2341 domain-containing protein [Chitinophagales bacterium]